MPTKLIKAKKVYPSKKVAPAVKRYVAKVIDKSVEDKFIQWDMSTEFATVGTTWVETNLANLTQGQGQAKRECNRIKVKSVEIKGIVAQNGSSSMQARTILALWDGKQNTPLATSGISIDNPVCKETNGKGYLRRKYLDKYITFDPIAKTFKYYKKFKNLYIQWSTDGTDYPNKTLSFGMITSDSDGAPTPCFLTGYMLLKYENA